MPRRCEPHPPAHAIAAHLLPPTPPTPVYATATTAHSGQAPACDQLPNELLIKVLQRLYLVPAVDTLVDACAVVSRRWRQCTLHVLRNPPPIPSLAGRSPADELAARRLRREVAVDLGFMPASPVLVPSAFQVVADTAADTTHAHGWRVRLIAHPTLHGGPLLTMQTRFGSEALRATLIDGSSGLESLRDAIIRLGRMRLIDQSARQAAATSAPAVAAPAPSSAAAATAAAADASSLSQASSQPHAMPMLALLSTSSLASTTTSASTLNSATTPTAPFAAQDWPALDETALFEHGGSTISRWQCVNARQAVEILPCTHAQSPPPPSSSSSTTNSSRARRDQHEPCVRGITFGHACDDGDACGCSEHDGVCRDRGIEHWWDCAALRRSVADARRDGEGSEDGHDSDDQNEALVGRSMPIDDEARGCSLTPGWSALWSRMLGGIAVGDQGTLSRLHHFVPPTASANGAVPHYLFAITPSRCDESLGTKSAGSLPRSIKPRRPCRAADWNPYRLFKARFYFVWQDVETCIHGSHAPPQEDPNAQDQNMHDLDAHGGQALETAQDAHHARVRDASVAPMSSRRTLETIEQILDARRPLGPEAAGGDSDGFYIVVCGGAVPDGVSGRDAFDDILESRGPHARLSPMHRRYGLLALGRCDAVGDSGSDLGALCIDARMRCDGGLDVAVDAGSVSGLDGNTALVRI
ncbi:hypothetical protein HK105_202593 [Polyrhizophydium stewartii]|uniref:F-box domain-containing protein n=1 Tax=Polyrhizophydium stewartii TaxID=2732419 RepID=A0ABR4NDW3_9FUNG